MGTLSKAVGVLGGYVAGSAALRDLLTQRARPFLFSTSHPPAVAAACIEALKVMREEGELFERLWANTRRFKAELARLGFDTGVSETPITPIIVGDSEAAIRFSDRLFEAGVFATSVVYPTVASGRRAAAHDRHGRPHRRAPRPRAGDVGPRRPRAGAHRGLITPGRQVRESHQARTMAASPERPCSTDARSGKRA